MFALFYLFALFVHNIMGLSNLRIQYQNIIIACFETTNDALFWLWDL